MKDYLLQLFILFFSLSGFSQEIPRVVLQDSSYLKLSDLSVKTEIVGNIATTSYTMKFYNNTDRILEGELAFPLGQGQSVTNFGMDVNGKMREAVIVEKELGRVAYESTVRQTIDPGLLEITKGNNYKARVYPIPAKGFKTLSITFEEELKASENNHLYYVPFNFEEPLDFKYEIEIYNTNQTPRILDGKQYNLKFERDEHMLRASTQLKNTKANQPLKMELPLLNTEVVSTFSNYFNVYKAFEVKSRYKANPQSIALFWDASYSMQYRNLENEFELLDNYFKHLQNVKVELFVFSNALDKKQFFNVNNGNWKALKKTLESIVYDGGTSYLDFPDIRVDEILFFTDGMHNLGEFNTVFSGNLYTINAVNSANHEYLYNTSFDFNGKYINLKNTSVDEAVEHLKTEAFRFLGYTSNSDVNDVFPAKNTPVTSDFSVSGKFDKPTSIELLFGYGKEVTERLNVNLEPSNFNGLVKRLWAKKKLANLNRNKEEHQSEITELGKKYHLITDYTSMIILDRLEDYVRYEIEPPAELKAEYKERIANIHQEKQERLEEIKERKEELIDDYKELLKWYNTSYPIAKIVEPKPTQVQAVETTNENNNSNQEANGNSNSGNNRQTQQSVTNNLDNTKRIVTGTITDEDGLPLPGANVIIKGTRNGTQTDFDGNFAINAETGETLEITYVGYNTNEVVVGTVNQIKCTMKADESRLEEVVVVAYGVQRRSSMTGSVSVVKTESVTDAMEVLNGRVAGVQVAGASGTNNTITIRGVNSLNEMNEPLYIVDGKVVTDSEYRSILTDSIHSIRVLKDATAASLYGSRGSNGVLVITTKNGLEQNWGEIEDLNEKIDSDIQFKPWSPNNDYLKIISAQSTVENAYQKYIELRVKFRNTPSFFIDVADFFESKKEMNIAVKVLTNLAEIDLDNHEVLKALAYKLEYFKKNKLALYVYKEVLKLRPEEPQSTRDLALAHEYNGNYQKAFDLLFSLVNGDLVEKDLDARFYGIEHIALIEAGHLLKKHGNNLKLSDTQKSIVFPVEMDLRIVADWNHNDTDLDLWIDNPKEQSISYKNQTTDYGDRLSEDMTEGYGPEEYILKNGLKGKYEMEVDYYANSSQKISGPTILKITIFKNYGKANETKEIRVLRLSDEKEEVEVGSVSF